MHHEQPQQSADETSARTAQEAAVPERFADLKFHFDEDSGVLTASVAPSHSEVEMDADALHARLRELGYAEFSFQPDAVQSLVRRLRDRELGDYAIATRVDAEVSVGVTADKLQALLTTTRAYGGERVTKARVRDAIARAKIVPDMCLDQAIDKALEEESVTNLVVAQGVEPKAGEDSRFELLVDLESETHGPKETSAGRVDHYLQRDFVIVEEGTPLLRYFPATPGVPGRDVLGAPVVARDGKDIPLPKDVPGVRAAADDENVLVADYKGHPVAISGGIRVDKTLVMDYVDLRTGNVDFDGSVLIKGDVTAGVLVKATGDVNVKGSVENASVEAGGDVHVARGVTGSESAMRGGARTVHVQGGRDVHAAFAGGVRIGAGRDVVVKEYLSHCETFARGRVLVGQSGGRGLIVGGICHGCQGVGAKMAGTLATVTSRIGAGVHDDLRRAHEQALGEGAALADQLQQLRQALTGMVERARAGKGDEGQGMLDKLRRTVAEFERRAEENDRHIEALEGEMQAAEEAGIRCKGPVYPGVTIQIGEATLSIRNEASGGRFTSREGEIIWD